MPDPKPIPPETWARRFEQAAEALEREAAWLREAAARMRVRAGDDSPAARRARGLDPIRPARKRRRRVESSPSE